MTSGLIIPWLALLHLAFPQAEPVLVRDELRETGSSLAVNGDYLVYTGHIDALNGSGLRRGTLAQGLVEDSEPLLIGGQAMPGGDGQISPDGQSLVFYSRAEGSGADADLYLSHRTAQGWSGAERLPDAINSAADEYYPVLSDDGSLYLARRTPEASLDIFVSRRVDGAYQPAQALPSQINTSLLESDAYIAPDQSFMIFVRMHDPEGLGLSDMFLSCRRAQGWSQAVNLGPGFNSVAVDGSPFVTRDRAWLYFTSNRSSDTPEVFDGRLGLYRVPLGAEFIDQHCADQE